MQAFVVSATLEQTTGVLINDEDLALHDDVVLVTLEEFLGLDRVIEVTHEWGVNRVVKIVDAELVLDLVDCAFVHTNRALLLIDFVVHVDLEGVDDARKLGVPLSGLIGRAADDEWRACLVNEDGVDLVDHCEVVAALHHLFARPGHVVAQVVKAEFVVGAVSDVRGIGLTTCRGVHVGHDDAYGKSQEAMDAAHPLRVTLCEVVIDGDDMDAFAGNCVEVRGQGRDEGLALTGAHLGDVAQVQGRPTHDLHVVVPLAQGATGGLTYGRECLGHECIEGLPLHKALLVFVGKRAKIGIAHSDELVL